MTIISGFRDFHFGSQLMTALAGATSTLVPIPTRLVICYNANKADKAVNFPPVPTESSPASEKGITITNVNLYIERHPVTNRQNTVSLN